MKIAMLFPYAPSYREPIYQLMDREFDIDWFFCGNAERPLKLFDYNLLKNCNLEMEEKKVVGLFTRYVGLNALHLQNYDALIIAGVYQNLSEWKLAFKFGRCRKSPKLFFWTHGMYGKESMFRRFVKNMLYKSADGMLLYGNYAKNIMVDLGYDKKKLFVIHNSLDYEKQLSLRKSGLASTIYNDHFKNSNPTLLFIGRLTKVKQLDMFIDAVFLLKQRGQHYNVVFVGDGTERSALEQYSLQSGISDQVWFYGECYDEKSNAELIYNADLCVAPGNIGLTAMHVLMFGCPAITHDDFKWQMPEFESIQPYKTGLFFKHNDVNDLADKIAEWFRVNGGLRDDVREQCYQEIDNYWTPQFQIGVLHQALNY